MWYVESIAVNGKAFANARMSDGHALDTPRGDAGSSVRLNLDSVGFLDFTTLADGPSGGEMDISGLTLRYDGEAALNLTLRLMMLRGAPTFICWVSWQGGQTGGIPVSWFFAPLSDQIAAVTAMENAGIIPYRNDPNGGKTPAQIRALGEQYFPYDAASYEMALSVYDWTTADFFRMDLFNIYRYTALPGAPLDYPQIAEGIWTANWGSYNPGDSDFMNSFMMKPADSLQQVSAQLDAVGARLADYLTGLKGCTASSMAALPRITTQKYPALYSGQISIQNLGNDALAVYFEEYPGNAGPVGAQMGMPIAQALKGFMAPGNVVTMKSFLSFTDSREGAMHYSNGILLSMSPPAGAVWGNDITWITPLSDEANKIEYTLLPGSRIRVSGWNTVSYQGKTITEISLDLLGDH